MSGVLMEYREAFRMYPIYKDFQEKARSDESQNKKLAEDRILIFDEQLMMFCMGNAIVIEDTNGNRKLLKTRYDQKIDAVSAMMDAYVSWSVNRELFE